MNKIKKIDIGIKTLRGVYITKLSNGSYTIGYSIVDFKKLREAMRDFYNAYPREDPIDRTFPVYSTKDTLEFFVEKVHNFFTKESKELRVGSPIILLNYPGTIDQDYDGYYYITFNDIFQTNHEIIRKLYNESLFKLAQEIDPKSRRVLSPHFTTIDNLIKFVNTVNDQKLMQKPHVYHVGDKVRIKERKGGISDYPFAFIEDMARLKGKIYKISDIQCGCIKKGSANTIRKYYNGDNCKYYLENSEYTWHSSMFEPVVEDPESQTLISLKEGDLIPICGMIGKIHYCTSFMNSGYYLDFDDIEGERKHYTCCKKLRKIVSNFDEIAHECCPINHKAGEFFPEFSTISDLMKFVQAVNNAYNSEKSITTPKTLNEYEPNRLQKPKASVIRGTVPEGHSCSSRKNKIATAIGRLSYRVCNS